MNALRAFGGEPVEVQAHQVVGETGVDVVFAASLRLSNNVLAHFDCGFFVPFRDERARWGGRKPLRGRPIPCSRARDRAATWIWNRAARGACRKLVSPGTRERERRDLRPGAAELSRGDAVGQARAIEALYDAAAVEALHTSA